MFKKLFKKEPEPKLDCLTSEEKEIVKEIGLRAHLKWEENAISYNMIDAMMDVTAIHCNGNPLKLKELLEASDADFVSEMSQIKLFLNRKTGRLDSAAMLKFTSKI